MKKIAVVTVNFNTAKDTTTFLHSLKHVKSPEIDLSTVVAAPLTADWDLKPVPCLGLVSKAIHFHK